MTGGLWCDMVATGVGLETGDVGSNYRLMAVLFVCGSQQCACSHLQVTPVRS